MSAAADARQALLEATLQAAVPLWIERLREYSWSYRRHRAHVCAAAIAAHGDQLMHLGPETAATLDRLCEGVALLALAPGGVEALGLAFGEPA